MTIRTATLDGVATIEIARPQKKNAITAAMYGELAAAFEAATVDATVRAVLITGQPDIFTSGNDVEDFLARPPSAADGSALDSPAFAFMRAMMACDKPIVAGVTGAAIGIGTTMLLHCDLVYVADDSRLAMPFVASAGARVRVERARAAGDGQPPGGREAAARRPVLRSRGGRVRDRQRRAAFGGGRAACASHRRALQGIAAGAVRATKRLLQRADGNCWPRRSGSRARRSASACRAPRPRRRSAPSSWKRKPDFSQF
jgi:enoyl-CoA hydratase/carnithine racemase